jgi:hypothetical protein
MKPLERGWLAFLSMAAVWLCSFAACFLMRLEVILGVWIGLFALVSYLFFVLPVVAGTGRRMQLRFWYLLMLLSVAWALGLISFFCHQSPVSILTTPVENIIGYWAIAYALGASGLYLLLLRSRGRTQSSS